MRRVHAHATRRPRLLTGRSLERWTSTCIETPTPSVASAPSRRATRVGPLPQRPRAGTHSVKAIGPRQRSQSPGITRASRPSRADERDVAALGGGGAWERMRRACACSRALGLVARAALALLRVNCAAVTPSASPIHSYARAPLSAVAVAALFGRRPVGSYASASGAGCARARS